MGKMGLPALAGILLALFLGAPTTVLAQGASDDVKKEIDKELEASRKALMDRISAVLSKQEERIASLEKQLKERDTQIADLRKKLDDQAAKSKPESVPATPLVPAQPAAKGNALLGVATMPPGDDVRAKLNLREGQGALVTQVLAGSPAQKAGVETGDVLLSFGGKDVTPAVLRESVLQRSAGDKVEIVFLHGAEKMTKTVELASREGPAAVQAPVTPQAKPPETPAAPGAGPVVLGLLVEDTTAGPEVENVEPGKTGAVAQIKEGDLILCINGKHVKNGDELGAELAKAKPGDEIAIEYKRKDQEFKAKVVGAGEKGEAKLIGMETKGKEPEPKKPEEPAKDTPKPEAPKPETPAAKTPGSLGVQILEDAGLKVFDAKAGGAAAAAGIKAGDVIVKINGAPVRTLDELRAALKDRVAGDTVAVTVTRDGQEKTFDAVKLGGAPGAAPPKPEPKPEPVKKQKGTLGIIARENDGGGLLIENVNEKGAAEKAGLKAGDVIEKINGADIKGFDDLANAMKDRTAGETITLIVKRGGEKKEIQVTLGAPETSSAFPPRDGASSPVYLGLALIEQGAPAAASARVAIGEVYEDSPAAAAGLLPGDEVLSIEGREVRNLDDLSSLLGARSPGDRVDIHVARKGQTVEADVVLGRVMH